MSVGAVILAAGAGERFGLPKALAPMEAGPPARIESGAGEKSWLGSAIDHISLAGLSTIVVVLGAGAEEVQRSLRAQGIHLSAISIVYNADWTLGRTGSIQCGLNALPASCGGALLHQVDFPDVQSDSFAALQRSFELDPAGEACIFLPSYGGRRGHPILLGRGVWPEIFALGPDEPLSQVVRRQRARVREVPLDDPGILVNRNFPNEEPQQT